MNSKKDRDWKAVARMLAHHYVSAAGRERAENLAQFLTDSGRESLARWGSEQGMGWTDTAEVLAEVIAYNEKREEERRAKEESADAAEYR